MADLISRREAIDALKRDEEYNEDIPNRADGVRDAIITISGLPSAQPESAERNEESKRNVPNDDLISRKMAIEKFWHSEVEFRPTQIDEVMAILKELPSAQRDTDEWCSSCKEYDTERHCCPRWNRVIREALKDAQPERKTGKWNTYVHSDTDFSYSCNMCGYSAPFQIIGGKASQKKWNFCPNCGADMRGERQ